ncbi:MAG: hypothetical protein KME09_00955 [Pleurocapsa minor HA4230-MV1]|jgi:hypothetical protein|nr:hypothetical protein [Pleurocapsa minor HA4230-MV1]
MKLPNSDQAVLGDKLEQYCLNTQHLQGKHKAFLFHKKLGITLENKAILEQALLQAIRENNNVVIYKQDRYGIHYDIKFRLQTEVGSSLILSSWIIRHQETFPRLTNVYPVNK